MITAATNFLKKADVKSQFSLVALCLSLALCWDSGLPVPVYSSSQAPGDPRPSNAVEGSLKAFDKFPLVAFGERHLLQEEADFIALLIRDPAFSTKVNHIVVEFGNALYQDVMDHYVAGKEVPPTELRQVWRNTTQLLTWNAPMYKKFFAQVRALNQTLPASRRLRILLGDPQIDWNKVQSREEFLSIEGRRPSHYAKVVEDEVLAKGRKALLIAGEGHFARQSVNPMDNVGRLIEKRHPKSLFVIISHVGFQEQNEELEPRLVSWPKPSLAILKGARLGAIDASLVMMALNSRDGGKCIYNPYGETLLEVAADAYLYLGPSDSLTNSLPSPDIFKDEDYVKELKRRFKIMGSDFDPAPHVATLMRESSKKFDYRLPIKPQKKCP